MANTTTQTVKPARKAKSASSIASTKTADKPIAIAMVEYGALEKAFDFLNAKLFGGKLPDVMFNYTRKPHMLGPSRRIVTQAVSLNSRSGRSH